MAEKTARLGNLPEEQKRLLEDASQMQTKVMKRLEDSVVKYGAAYALADIEKEFDNELLDLPGWTLLMATRMRQVVTDRLALLNEKYLERFLSFNDDEYLTMLHQKIGEELVRRDIDRKKG